MGVTVREKVPGSGVYWVFIRHGKQRRSRRIGSEKAATYVAAGSERRLHEGGPAFIESAPVPCRRSKRTQRSGVLKPSSRTARPGPPSTTSRSSRPTWSRRSGP